MPQIKKQAYDKVVRVLQKEKDTIYSKLRKNKYDIKNLAEEQKVLKKEFTILIDTIKELTGKKHI